MPPVRLTKKAIKELDEIKKSDPKLIIKINQLLQDCLKNPASGLGKVEKLKGFEDLYSRRINKKDKLVYSISKDVIVVYQLKGHYDDK